MEEMRRRGACGRSWFSPSRLQRPAGRSCVLVVQVVLKPVVLGAWHRNQSAPFAHALQRAAHRWDSMSDLMVRPGGARLSPASIAVEQPAEFLARPARDLR